LPRKASFRRIPIATNFQWVVEAVSEMAIRKAKEHIPGRDNLSWGKYVQSAVARRALSDAT
jgi:hypothetical protein